MVVGGFQYVSLGTLTMSSNTLGWYACDIPRDTALKFDTNKTVIMQDLHIKMPEINIELNVRNLAVNIMLHTEQFTSNTDTYYFSVSIPNIVGARGVTDAIIAVTIAKTEDYCKLQMYML